MSAALPDAGGFDGYVRRALGPTAAYLTGMSVAIALAVGAGLASSFGEAYVSAWLGFGGWPVKIALLVLVMGPQLRGASEAVSLTVAVGVAALVILVAFCLFMAPEFDSPGCSARRPMARRSLFPHGIAGAAGCIPFALFLFLGVEQAAHAAAEMRDMARNMPKALAMAIGVAFVIGLCVLLIATGGAGADRLAAVDDPLFAADRRGPRADRGGIHVEAGRRRGLGGHPRHVLLAGLYRLAPVLPSGAGRLPAAGVRPRQRAPGPGGGRVPGGRDRARDRGFAPNSAMVVFIFLISVSHALLLAAFIQLRRREPGLARTYRALGGLPIAVVALLLSLSVMVSCYQLEVRALQIAIAAIAVLVAQFLWLKPARFSESES